MGIDGFSLSNLGLNKNLTSAQLANESERTARQSLENQITDSDGIGKIQKAGRKDPDAAFNGMIPFIPDDKTQNDTENEEEDLNDTEKDNDIDNEESDEISPRYSFRYNEEDMIEIIDGETNEIIKRIRPEDAAKVMLNISDSPGVLFNKKI